MIPLMLILFQMNENIKYFKYNIIALKVVSNGKKVLFRIFYQIVTL